MWRLAGVGVLPRHDGEVEGVVLKEDTVLDVGVRGRARYAQAMSQNDDAICFRAGCCDMSNLTASLARL
jgi:hypothetical protein